MSEANAAAITFPSRFNGPPGMAHGGYVGGAIARLLIERGASAAEVRLVAPTPMEVPLDIEWSGDGVVQLLRGESIVTEGRAADLAIDLPPLVGLDEAASAVLDPAGFPLMSGNACFGCGHDRRDDDGLRLFPGPVDGRDLIACPVTVPGEFRASDGSVPIEMIWTALDCPTLWVWLLDALLDGGQPTPAITGTMAAAVRRTVRAEDRLVVNAWRLGREGRKRFAGAALSTAEGEYVAEARATLIELG